MALRLMFWYDVTKPIVHEYEGSKAELKVYM